MNGEADVADVDERPPGRPVAHDRHLAGRCREPDEVVHDDVTAEPRRVAVRSRIPEIDGAERLIGELAQVTLREDLRFAVGRHRIEVRVLVEQVVALRPVDAARRGEDEAIDPASLASAASRTLAR